MSVQYQLNDAVQLYGGIDNFLNQSYPINIGPNATTNSTVGGDAFHDIIGRRFKVGFRFKL
jgi:outer membrane receptor protein involved in Fe transport